MFEHLLPQLSYALPSVNAAAAALGAVYEMQTAPRSALDSKRWLVETQYGAAVRGVQHELRSRPYGEVPILLACVLLACADVLLCRQRLALMHLRGAIRLLEERNAMSTVPSIVSGPVDSFGGINDGVTSRTEPLTLEEEDDDVTVFFRTLDVQTVSYADGLPPQMHIALVRTPQGTTTSALPCLHRTGRELIALMQAGSCFTSYASQYTYRPRIFVPTNLAIEQGRHIAALKLWLRGLDYGLLPYIKASTDSTSAASSKYTHCLMLRNLCLSAIIYISTILDPYETGWDKYAGDFQEIITGAESILDNRRRRKRCGALPSSTSAFTFTPSPGIIQPLHLTVFKYRHPRWRRRALELLRHSGKEGPWDGKLMAAAAQRAIEIEESELVRDRGSSIEVEQAVHLEDIVPEHVRISGCGPDNSTDGEGALDWEWMKELEYMSRQGSMGRENVSRVRFSRCKDVNRMLVAGLDGQSHGDAAWLGEHWENWAETVKL
jgi:hypothetical protein